MRSLWVFCFVWLLCISVEAAVSERREVEHPCFIATNTSKIEIRKIILTDAHTQVDAVMYGNPGEPLVLSSNTFLTAGKASFRLRETDKVSIDGLTEPDVIPESGHSYVTLSFEPVPRDTHEINFVEKDFNWKIWGIQLVDKEPYVYLPSFLENQSFGMDTELPTPVLKVGRNIINGYVLGYEPSMEIEMTLHLADWMFPEAWSKQVKILPDGAFHIETNLLTGTPARLQVNGVSLNLLMMPGEEMMVYIHLPRLSMSGSEVLKKTFRNRQKAWYTGSCEALNTELATRGYPLELEAFLTSDEKAEMKEMSAEDYQASLVSLMDKKKNALTHDKKVSQTFRNYVMANWNVDLCRLLAQRGIVPDASDDFYSWYGYRYADYQDAVCKLREPSVLWKDITGARAVIQDCMKKKGLTSPDKKKLEEIQTTEVRNFTSERIKQVEVLVAREKAVKGHVVEHLDTLVQGADILPAILAAHRGQAVLLDFWATWCGPCKKSFTAMRPLKESLSGKDIVYIYLTGPTSPELVWRGAVSGMNGVHYRLSKPQWDYLCKSYGITGIPGYLVIGYDGKLLARYVGFPGVDVLQKDLLRAMGQ